MAIKPKIVKAKTNITGKKILGERITDNLKKQRINLTKAQTEAVLTEFLEETKQALIKGEEIRFPGYYSLKTATQKARVAMNLQTKKKMNIPAKRVPKAKFSIDLKEQIAKRK